MKTRKTTPEPIDLWSIRLSGCREQLNACSAALSDSEKKRAERFIKPADRERYVLCRGILRRILADDLSVDPADVEIKRTAQGKPYLPGGELEFNVSHSRDRLLIAAAGRAVGVDIEFRRDGLPMDAIAERWFAPQEKAFFQSLENPRDGFFDIWAGKEAFVKARGEGIFRELRSFCVPLPPGSAQPLTDLPDGWGFQCLEIDPDYSAALVWKKHSHDEHPPEVRFR
jgi:4'-phosphopantetheinyl transferase